MSDQGYYWDDSQSRYIHGGYQPPPADYDHQSYHQAYQEAGSPYPPHQGFDPPQSSDYQQQPSWTNQYNNPPPYAERTSDPPYAHSQQPYSPPQNYEVSSGYASQATGESYSYYNQVGPVSDSQYGYQQQSNPNSETDRGIMGAVAGAAVGGYGGHKVNHGFLGAVGGAIAGSKLEDYIKDEKKKKKKEKKSRFGFSRRDSSTSSSSSSSSSSDDEKKKRTKKKHHLQPNAAVVAATAAPAIITHHPPPPTTTTPAILAGNFSSSCTNITLDHDHDLIALCRALDGSSRLSSISLNSVLTNDRGTLKWGRAGNFGLSSRNVRLIVDGSPEMLLLEAELGTGDGGWRWNRVGLDERITNEDGELKFLG